MKQIPNLITGVTTRLLLPKELPSQLPAWKCHACGDVMHGMNRPPCCMDCGSINIALAAATEAEFSHAKQYIPGSVVPVAEIDGELPVTIPPGAVGEFRFHPRRQWRFDYAWPAQMVALEIEGGVWSRGRHTRGKGFEHDCIKYMEAAVLGWTVLRVTPKMVADGRAWQYVTRVLQCRGK